VALTLTAPPALHPAAEHSAQQAQTLHSEAVEAVSATKQTLSNAQQSLDRAMQQVTDAIHSAAAISQGHPEPAAQLATASKVASRQLMRASAHVSAAAQALATAEGLLSALEQQAASCSAAQRARVPAGQRSERAAIALHGAQELEVKLRLHLETATAMVPLCTPLLNTALQAWQPAWQAACALGTTRSWRSGQLPRRDRLQTWDQTGWRHAMLLGVPGYQQNTAVDPELLVTLHVHGHLLPLPDNISYSPLTLPLNAATWATVQLLDNATRTLWQHLQPRLRRLVPAWLRHAKHDKATPFSIRAGLARVSADGLLTAIRSGEGLQGLPNKARQFAAEVRRRLGVAEGQRLHDNHGQSRTSNLQTTLLRFTHWMQLWFQVRGALLVMPPRQLANSHRS